MSTEPGKWAKQAWTDIFDDILAEDFYKDDMTAELRREAMGVIQQAIDYACAEKDQRIADAEALVFRRDAEFAALNKRIAELEVYLRIG